MVQILSLYALIVVVGSRLQSVGDDNTNITDANSKIVKNMLN